LRRSWPSIHNGAAPGDPRQIDGLIYGHTTPDGVYQLPGEEGTATDLTDAQRQRLATNFKYYQDSYAKLVSCVNLEHATTKGQFGFPRTILDFGPYQRTVVNFKG